MKLSKLVKFRNQLKMYPPTTHGKHVQEAVEEKVKKLVDRRVNSRGKGLRFIKKNGRIIPIRSKSKK